MATLKPSQTCINFIEGELLYISDPCNLPVDWSLL